LCTCGPIYACFFWKIVATVELNIYDAGDAAAGGGDGDDGDNVRIFST
jgi:hypothetical protein